jgi:hypothetical protein
LPTGINTGTQRVRLQPTQENRKKFSGDYRRFRMLTATARYCPLPDTFPVGTSQWPEMDAFFNFGTLIACKELGNA